MLTLAASSRVLVPLVILHLTAVVNCLDEWPGGSAVYDASEKGEFGDNMSGMYLNEDQISSYAVQNSGRLYKLELSGGMWLKSTDENWGNGKQIVYSNGGGIPDAEDITKSDVDWMVYVCTERNDEEGKSKISRMSILNYDIRNTGNETTLEALQEWDVTKFLPESEENEGLEAITWVPDSYLTKHHFIDESTSSAYLPHRYPSHGNGLFFVGLESDGKVYAFALNHIDGEAHLVSDFKTEERGIMALHFDREVEYLWTLCDNTCGGRQEVYTIEAGKFDSQGVFQRPEDMKNLNNEGFTAASESGCVDGLKPVYWTDDSDEDGVSIRSGTVECGQFLTE